MTHARNVTCAAIAICLAGAVVSPPPSYAQADTPAQTKQEKKPGHRAARAAKPAPASAGSAPRDSDPVSRYPNSYTPGLNGY